MSFSSVVKWILFPGINLNLRLRYRVIPQYLGTATNREREVLEAGCGNGALAYQCYLRGNRVLAISIKDEVKRNRQLFNVEKEIPEQHLCFQELNLYDCAQLGSDRFDEIICTEVLEHIRGDDQVVRSFFRLLKPEGILHLCCPNADHPYHRDYPLDPHETGGHVRPGYTEETYRELLEPVGFELSPVLGIGGTWRHRANEGIRIAQKCGGRVAGVITFFFLAGLPCLDRAEPRVPFSLYVRARKPPVSRE